MEFSDRLIAWYEKNKRDLPWRTTSDSYRIWISEIILQQTRVNQGLDYYRRFIERFPDVAALAAADDDEVMRLWQGLGYYSRARNLLAAARQTKGVFPVSYQDVRAMKGVGDYTAAAVCSIAYNMPYAVVDGNVYRVLSRYFGVSTPIDTTMGRKEFAELAQSLLDSRRPGIYNQAVMDFGALQCTPSSPDCRQCPFVDGCVAFGQGLVDRLPMKAKKAKMRVRYFNYLCVVSGNAVFLHKRMGNDIWKNLYEFPLVETGQPVSDMASLAGQSSFKDLFRGKPVDTISCLIRDVKHVLSHQVLMTNLYRVDVPDDVQLSDCIKVPIAHLSQFALPALLVKLLPLLIKR